MQPCVPAVSASPAHAHGFVARARFVPSSDATIVQRHRLAAEQVPSLRARPIRAGWRQPTAPAKARWWREGHDDVAAPTTPARVPRGYFRRARILSQTLDAKHVVRRGRLCVYPDCLGLVYCAPGNVFRADNQRQQEAEERVEMVPPRHCGRTRAALGSGRRWHGVAVVSDPEHDDPASESCARLGWSSCGSRGSSM
jgi:hypothetical protein